mgnify:CR=1 FL=1|jgi:CheY-like chemotaxis protein
MEKPQVLVAHERPVIGHAIARVLAAQGLRVQVLSDGHRVADALKADAWDALILDVALPGAALHELVELARTGLPLPIKAVLLIASVFRRSSYKRKPQRLYGADDYVEVHNLGEQLPGKLWRLLAPESATSPGMFEADAVLAALQDEHEPEEADAARASAASRLAALLVADLVLHSGERLADAESLDEIRVVLGAELEVVRAIHREALGSSAADDDPIDAALAALLHPPAEPAEDSWS